ncbi:MAG: aminoglycoside phosphotransferase family protein [Cyanobacteria bacterium P01_E01_bin.34]
MDSHLRDIAGQFCSPNAISSLSPLGNGRINDTYLVCLTAPHASFVLQRINSTVFSRPEAVMRNLVVFAQHAVEQLSQLALPSARRWEIPTILSAGDDERPFVYDDTGYLWRAIGFIDSSISIDTIQTVEQAEEVGIALGIFHTLVSNLPCDRLTDTLPGFHSTPRYLQQYDERLAAGLSSHHQKNCADCMQFVEKYREEVGVLEEAKAAGILTMRPIHGDPKVNNILFDCHSHRAISIIDLDTVKPGLIQYDIGDCLRSGCNPAGSNATELENVCFDLQNFRAILQGYCSVARSFLSDRDYDYLYAAIRLIPLELGLRYLMDYLNGNVYFKVSYPEQALQRARVQFALTSSIEQQKDEILREIEHQRSSA